MPTVYVSCAGSGEVRVYRLGPDGTLDPVQVVAPGGQVMPMAASPDRRFLHVARRSAPLAVVSYAIDPASGALAERGEAPLPHSMAYLATDRSGRWLLSASYGDDRVAVSALGADGVAAPAHQVLSTGRHAHAIQADPSNRHVFASVLGAGCLACYRFDAVRGELAPADPPTFTPRAGASPRHFVFGPSGRRVYLLNELDARIDVLAHDAGRLRLLQTVDTLPPGFADAPWAADLHLDAAHGRLLASERRSGTLALFGVDPASGLLALQARLPTEPEPRGFALSPDGRFAVVAGQASGRLAVVAIGERTLAPVASVATGAKPNWVEIVASADA